jgi:long-subunit fatty acid transport protein
MRSTVVVAWLAAAAAPPLAAQSNDHLYRAWRWTPLLGSPRAAGLGGAFVALADDCSSVQLNPAGMLALPKTELAVALSHRGAATVGLGDRWRPVSGLGFAGGSGRLGPRFAIGGYATQLQRSLIELADSILPDQSRYSGSLETTITEGGGAVAYAVNPHLSVGGRLTATHLKLEGAYRRSGSVDLPDLESGSAAGDTRVTTSFGILYSSVHSRLRVGLAVYTGASYAVQRVANDPRTGAIDPGSEYELRQPTSLAGGAALQITPKLVVAGQVDFVRYSEAKPFRRPGTVQDGSYQLEDGVEPRFGIEFSQPFGAWSLQLRTGLHSQASTSASYSGPNPAEALAYSGDGRRTLLAMGASVVARSGVRADLAITWRGEATDLVVGVAARF